MTDYYEDNLQYISEELKRIDLLIHLQVLRIRQKKDVVDGFQGLYISDEEINSILDDTYPTNDGNQHIQTLNSFIAEIETQIEEKVIESQKKGIALNLPLLAAIFGLTSFEIDAMLICMALELDTDYERLYAYLRNDATIKQPSVDLILGLLCNSSEDKIYARQYFYVDAPLFKNQIIRFAEESEEEKKPLLSRLVKMDDRIINCILGFNQIDTKIEPFTRLVLPHTDLGAVQSEPFEAEALSDTG